MKSSPEQLAYAASYRESHREEMRAYNAAYNAAHRAERCEKDAKRQVWFLANLRILKQAQGREDCRAHEGRLEHHHMDSETKRFDVSSMYNCSLESFMDEIAKCTVLCQPCHMKRHSEMRALAA